MVVIHDGAVILHVAKLASFTVNDLLLNSTAVEGVHFLFPFYIATVNKWHLDLIDILRRAQNPRVELIYRGFILNRLPENYAGVF